MHAVTSVPTVLAVDDEPANLLVVDAALSPLGYEVVTVSTPADAERFAALARPDLVLLDLMMGSDSGIEVCQRWRELPEWDAVPIVLLTAMSAGSFRTAGLVAGADDYLEKPIDVDELQRLARRWVATGRRHAVRPATGVTSGADLTRAMRRAASPRSMA